MSVVATRSRLRKWRIVIIIAAVMAAALWGGYEWLLSTAKTKINEELAARGLSLKYSGQTWSPWRGLTLKDAVLFRRSEGREPLIEITALHLDILWREAWRARAAVTRFRSNDATLTLHDEAGAVTHQVLHTLLDERLGEGINRTGGFVQDKYLRLIYNGPDKGDHLPLSYGEG